MNKDVKVSIIIPVYNAEKYLKQCLNSLANQTYSNIEIICVDDNSSDSSVEILKSFEKSDSRFIVITNSENKFAGVRRNQGFDASHGEYVIFLDSDDYFDENLIKFTLERAIASEADIVVFNSYCVDTITNNKKIKKSLYHIPNSDKLDCFNYKDYPDIILDTVLPSPWNKLYKSSFIKKHNLKYLDTKTSNDFTFASLSIALANKIAYLNKPLTYHRENVKNSITSKKAKGLNNVIIAVEELVKLVNQIPYANEINNSVLFFVVNQYVFSLDTYAKDYKPAKDFYNKLHDIFNASPYDSITLSTKYMYKKLFYRYYFIKKFKCYRIYKIYAHFIIKYYDKFFPKYNNFKKKIKKKFKN